MCYSNCHAIVLNVVANGRGYHTQIVELELKQDNNQLVLDKRRKKKRYTNNLGTISRVPTNPVSVGTCNNLRYIYLTIYLPPNKQNYAHTTCTFDILTYLC